MDTVDNFSDHPEERDQQAPLDAEILAEWDLLFNVYATAGSPFGSDGFELWVEHACYTTLS